MILDTVEQYVSHLREASRVLLELMQDADEETARTIWSDVAEAANQFVSNDGFKGPGEILIGTAIKQ